VRLKFNDERGFKSRRLAFRPASGAAIYADIVSGANEIMRRKS
jgi:hypothetical protein